MKDAESIIRVPDSEHDDWIDEMAQNTKKLQEIDQKLKLMEENPVEEGCLPSSRIEE
ncbi:hypothetical protein HDU76_011508 [Blyttiomyces sp. JEL0837]|nr:hypothetical protein HDU76_011508 [Blyttiomyces sp. JEL0837]